MEVRIQHDVQPDGSGSSYNFISYSFRLPDCMVEAVAYADEMSVVHVKSNFQTTTMGFDERIRLEPFAPVYQYLSERFLEMRVPSLNGTTALSLAAPEFAQ